MAEAARSAATQASSYAVLRELGARSLPSSAALRNGSELVVLQTFRRVDGGGDGARTVDAETMALLLRDARCVQKSWHPNLARVRHVDVARGELLLATEWIDGATLDDLTRAARLARGLTREAGPSLSPAVVARLLVDVAAGLGALHALRDGMQAPIEAVHGALCPANVVVARDGVARVVHLFRPRPPRVGADSEALAYAAPEVLDGDASIDARCDVYALGAILWEAIVGRPPHEHADAAAILHAQREGELTRPELAADSPWSALLDVAMSALRFDAGLRPRSASAFASDVRSAAADDLATSTDVAELVTKLAGERIRARRAELERRSSGVVRTSSRPDDAATADARTAASAERPLEVEEEPEAQWSVGVHDRATVESPLFADTPRSAPPIAAVAGAPPRPHPRGRTGTVRLSDVQAHPLHRPTPLATEIQLTPAVPTKARPLRGALFAVALVAAAVTTLAIALGAYRRPPSTRAATATAAAPTAPAPPAATTGAVTAPKAEIVVPAPTAREAPPAAAEPPPAEGPAPKPARPARAKKRYDPMGI
jgi:hypothetical protein